MIQSKPFTTAEDDGLFLPSLSEASMNELRRLIAADLDFTGDLDLKFMIGHYSLDSIDPLMREMRESHNHGS